MSHVPIRLEGRHPWLPAGWRRSLVLLREALEDRLGPVAVLAPSLPLQAHEAVRGFEEVQAEDGLRLLPSVEPGGSYWLGERARWRADVRAWVGRAHAVQAGLIDPWRPLGFDAFREARRQEKATVFVLSDEAARRRDRAARGSSPGSSPGASPGSSLWSVARLGAHVSGAVFDGAARYAVSTADLALLRAGAVMRRFAPHARNARAFQVTSHVTSEVVAAPALEDRLRRVAGQALRVVACGQVEASKGLEHAIDAVRLARQRGTPITFDIIGDGPERQRLEERVAALSLRAAVRFVGPAPAGPELLRRLADYDALLFTPVTELPPHRLFDGFAAGLPAVGYATEALRQRVEEDGAAVAVRVGDVDAAARALEELARDRERLAVLTRAAHRAALFHAADAWHRRRAGWILQAVDAAQTAAQAGRRARTPRRAA